jgi:outer membrane lipoprotein-sorting protein
MSSNDSMESMLRKLRYQATAEKRARTLGNIFHAMDEPQEQAPALRRVQIGRMTMKTRMVRFALAAAVILVVLGGLSLWPSGGKDQWWLAPPAAWGREITESLKSISALTYREGVVFVGDYGSTHTSGSWTRYYKATDRQRSDQYYKDTLVDTTWEVPDPSGSTFRCSVSYEFQCYTTKMDSSPRPAADPVDMLRFYVNLLDKADRVLDSETFEGKECVGFEISAAKYGNNPPERTDRVWFDKSTRLPVRIEHHGLSSRGSALSTTLVQDQFQYGGAVLAELFNPVIPEGFVNAPAATIRKARERQEKGEMSFAQVPAGLKEDVLDAFRQAQAQGVAYTEGGSRFSVSRNAWRVDRLEGDRVRTTEWNIIEKDDDAPTSLDFNDKNFRLVQTTVDYEARTWRQITRHQMPRHPVDQMAFIIELIDRADRFYESADLDGVKCFSFEVSAKKYGTNPDGALHGVWFDTVTKLPVRMEVHWPNRDGTAVTTTVQDQFQWDPLWPADLFVPQIPAGFTQIESAEK